MSLRKAMAYGTAVAATAATLGGAMLIWDRVQYVRKTAPLEKQAYQMKCEIEDAKAVNAEMKKQLNGYTRFIVLQGTTQWKDVETGEKSEWTGPFIYKELTLNPDMSITTNSIQGTVASFPRKDAVCNFSDMLMKRQQERMQ